MTNNSYSASTGNNTQVIGTYTGQLVGTYGSFQTSTPFTITVVA